MRLLNKGFTLVGAMITLSIVALLASISIPALLRTRMIANETAARTTLKTISTALETYAAEGGQGYPTDMSILLTSTPPYLNEDYTAGSREGYTFACGSLAINGYSCSAEPLNCNQTGSKSYVITTSGVLSETDCTE